MTPAELRALAAVWQRSAMTFREGLCLFHNETHGFARGTAQALESCAASPAGARG